MDDPREDLQGLAEEIAKCKGQPMTESDQIRAQGMVEILQEAIGEVKPEETTIPEAQVIATPAHTPQAESLKCFACGKALPKEKAWRFSRKRARALLEKGGLTQIVKEYLERALKLYRELSTIDFCEEHQREVRKLVGHGGIVYNVAQAEEIQRKRIEEMRNSSIFSALEMAEQELRARRKESRKAFKANRRKRS